MTAKVNLKYILCKVKTIMNTYMTLILLENSFTCNLQATLLLKLGAEEATVNVSLHPMKLQKNELIIILSQL